MTIMRVAAKSIANDISLLTGKNFHDGTKKQKCWVLQIY